MISNSIATITAYAMTVFFQSSEMAWPPQFGDQGYHVSMSEVGIKFDSWSDCINWMPKFNPGKNIDVKEVYCVARDHAGKIVTIMYYHEPKDLKIGHDFKGSYND